MSFFSKKLIRMSSSSLGTISERLKECGPIRLVTFSKRTKMLELFSFSDFYTGKAILD